MSTQKPVNRCVSNEQPCLKTTGLYDLLLLSSLFHFFYFIVSAGLILGLGRSLGGEHGNPFQRSYLENPMDRGVWKEDWVPKNLCFQIVVLEKTLESPLYCKEIKPVNPKRNQPWIFTGRTDAEAKGPILWPPDAKCHLEKTLILGKIEGRRRRNDRRWNG